MIPLNTDSNRKQIHKSVSPDVDRTEFETVA